MNNHSQKACIVTEYAIQRSVALPETVLIASHGGRQGQMPRSVLLQAFPGKLVNKLVHDGEVVFVIPGTTLETIVEAFLADISIDVIEPESVRVGLDGYCTAMEVLEDFDITVFE